MNIAIRLHALGYPGNTIYKEFEGGLMAFIRPFLFTYAIVTAYTAFLEEGTEDRWCYETKEAAEDALHAWDGAAGTEPEGWHRHPRSGRRRKEGDASREYVNR